MKNIMNKTTRKIIILICDEEQLAKKAIKKERKGISQILARQEKIKT